MKKCSYLLLLMIFSWSCSEEEPETAPLISHYMTTLDDEPVLQGIIADLSNSYGRVEEQLSSVNLQRVYKVDQPEEDQTVFSAPLTDGTMGNVVFANDEGNMFAFRMMMTPDDPLDQNIDASFTGTVHYETLDGEVFGVSSLENGQPRPIDNSRGKIETCWMVIDVYYTATEEGEVTHVEFGEGHVECDPHPVGEWIPSLSVPKKEGGGKKADLGLVELDGICPLGMEMYNGGCTPVCAQGHERNAQGDCVLRDKPCVDDPLVIMEISDHLTGGKNKNRFGCARNGDSCQSTTGKKWHGGIDLYAPIGTSVFSLTSGTVLYTQENHNDLGNWIIIHSGNYYYSYSHLSSLSNLQIGDNVSKGDILGDSGDTGNASGGGPHLHLEVRIQTSSGQSYNDATEKNPENYLGTKFDSQGNTINNPDC